MLLSKATWLLKMSVNNWSLPIMAGTNTFWGCVSPLENSFFTSEMLSEWTGGCSWCKYDQSHSPASESCIYELGPGAIKDCYQSITSWYYCNKSGEKPVVVGVQMRTQWLLTIPPDWDVHVALVTLGLGRVGFLRGSEGNHLQAPDQTVDNSC